MDKVILRVEGGRVTAASAPDGIDVVVCDFDVDGETEVGGRPCIIEEVERDEDFAEEVLSVLEKRE